MTLDQFITKWNGKEADWDGFYEGQCVDLFRYYCDEVLKTTQPDGVWGAANFWTEFDTDPILKANFTKIPNSPDFVPQKGDVMVWNFNAGGGFGHIGMCTGENTGLQFFKSFDQNWIKLSVCEVVNHNYNNVYGVLRPKGVQPVNGDVMEISTAQFEELVTKSTKYDGFASQGWTNPEQVTQAIETRDKAIVDLRKERDGAVADAEEWRKKLNDLVSYAAKALDCRIDEVEVRTKLDEIERVMTELEDKATNYSTDKLKWAETESELNVEIARLNALVKNSNVLENSKTSDLIREVVRRLIKIVDRG